MRDRCGLGLGTALLLLRTWRRVSRPRLAAGLRGIVLLSGPPCRAAETGAGADACAQVQLEHEDTERVNEEKRLRGLWPSSTPSSWHAGAAYTAAATSQPGGHQPSTSASHTSAALATSLCPQRCRLGKVPGSQVPTSGGLPRLPARSPRAAQAVRRGARWRGCPGAAA